MSVPLSVEVEQLRRARDQRFLGLLSADRRHVSVTGHSEYDPLTLRSEYVRDVGKNLPIQVPKNYFAGDDPAREPLVRWRGHANLLFANWLNYYVYQQTPYDLSQIPDGGPASPSCS